MKLILCIHVPGISLYKKIVVFFLFQSDKNSGCYGNFQFPLQSQVSVLRTNGPLVFIFRTHFKFIYLFSVFLSKVLCQRIDEHFKLSFQNGFISREFKGYLNVHTPSQYLNSQNTNRVRRVDLREYLKRKHQLVFVF